MAIKAILFDLDGTLLPMDQDAFIQAYFGGLAKKLAPLGYDPKKLVGAIWSGTEAMVKNDGCQTNEQEFWRMFTGIFGQNSMKDLPVFEDFYRNEFQQVQSVCGFHHGAAEVIAWVKKQGLRPILATNPLFPAIATESRTRWAGLEPKDFELITTYENSRHCKPNPEYYRDILNLLSLKPEECIMVGNDVTEDMMAEGLGMGVFLLTDCMINQSGKDISRYPHGSFRELKAFLEKVTGN